MMQQFITRLQSFSDRDIRALEIMSVFGAPMTLSMIKRALPRLGFKKVQDITTDWKERMIRDEILIDSSWRNTIADLPREYLSQKLATEGRYEEIYDVIHTIFGEEITEDSQKRVWLYSGNWDKLRKLKDFQGKQWRREHLLSTTFSTLRDYMDAAWLATLPEDIRWRLLVDYCGLLCWNEDEVTSPPLKIDEITRLLNSISDTPENRAKAFVLAELDLWQGDVTSAEARIALYDNAPAWAIRGRLALMRGETRLASDAFAEALDKAKSAELTSLDYVLMAFCWLANRQYDIFRKHVSSLKKKCRYPAARQCLVWFEAAANHLQMQQSLTPAMIRVQLTDVLSSGSVPTLLSLIVLDSLNLKLPSNLTEEMKAMSFIVAEMLFDNHLIAGSRWLAWQFLGYLDKSNPSDQAGLQSLFAENDKAERMVSELKASMQAAGYTLASDWIKKEEPWERSLQALLAFQSPASDGSDEQRLIWLFDTVKHEGKLLPFDPEPRLQQRLKSGAWGAGRKIKLERLGDPAIRKRDFPFLSAQDQRMCEKGIVESESHYWSYYQSEWEVHTIPLLLQADAHPHLFMKDVHTPFRVDKMEIVLQVVSEGDQIRILLSPSLKDAIVMQDSDDDDTIVLLRWQNPQHLQVYPLSEEILKIQKILGGDGLVVPASARERALDSIAAIAPLLNVHSEIGGGSQMAAEKVECDSRLHVQMQPIGDGLQISALVRPFGELAPLRVNPAEGAVSVFTEVEGKVLQTHRDLEREQAEVQKLFQLCPKLDAEEGWHWQLDDPEVALSTLEGLQQLGEDGDAVLEWPEGKALRVGKKVDTRDMRVSMHKQQDWFSVEGEVEVVEGQVMEIQQLMALMDQSPGRFVKLGDEQFINLSESLYKRLNALKSVTDGGRFHQLAAGAIDELTEGMAVRQNVHWKKHLSQLQEARDFQPQVPSTLQAELRDYQRDGFIWMARLAHWGAGACLADDMGLGKTVQALALILSHAAKGPTLVIAPTSVCMNWEDEAARFAPTLNVHAFGTSDRESLIAEVDAFDLVVCSYALLQRQGELLASREWQTVVLDEAQAIKNSMTKRSQAAMSLSANVRLITTGTPIENHLGELWTLFNFINPGLLGGLDSFTRRFANPIQVQEDEEVAQRLRQLIRPFILRRLKRDVLTELPPRTETTIYVELSNEELALYEAARRQALENIRAASEDGNPGSQRIKMLAEIMRLRRACCHPKLIMPDTPITGAKLTAFGETLDELRENGHKALVFSQFVAHLAILREYLEEKGISYQYLDGSTPAAQRKKRVNAFQNGEGDVFLISLKAGGAGLNLTAADYVLHMDPWWNPAVEDQASDRAHRMGQQRPVTIYRFIAKNTIEDKIIQLHHRKRDLADALLEGSDTAGALSLDDIRQLVESAGE